MVVRNQAFGSVRRAPPARPVPLRPRPSGAGQALHGRRGGRPGARTNTGRRSFGCVLLPETCTWIVYRYSANLGGILVERVSPLAGAVWHVVLQSRSCCSAARGSIGVYGQHHRLIGITDAKRSNQATAAPSNDRISPDAWSLVPSPNHRGRQQLASGIICRMRDVFRRMDNREEAVGRDDGFVLIGRHGAYSNKDMVRGTGRVKEITSAASIAPGCRTADISSYVPGGRCQLLTDRGGWARSRRARCARAPPPIIPSLWLSRCRIVPTGIALKTACDGRPKKRRDASLVSRWKDHRIPIAAKRMGSHLARGRGRDRPAPAHHPAQRFC
jgi:hypothetical protein